LAFFGFSLLSCHFWPFTGVLRKIFGSLTRKVSETFARRCKNEDSFGRAAKTNTRTCEHNGNSAAIRESIRLAEVALPPINGIKRYARRRFGRSLPTLSILLRRWCR